MLLVKLWLQRQVLFVMLLLRRRLLLDKLQRLRQSLLVLKLRLQRLELRLAQLQLLRKRLRAPRERLKPKAHCVGRRRPWHVTRGQDSWGQSDAGVGRRANCAQRGQVVR